MPSKFGGIPVDQPVSRFGGIPIEAAQPPPVQEPLPPGTFPSPAKPGGLEAGLSIASTMVGEIAGGVTGLATAAIPGTAPGSGAAVSKSVREAFTYDPRTEEGKQALQDIGGSELVQSIGTALKGAEKTLGDAGFDLAGPIGGTIGAVIPTAILEGLGLAAPAIAARTAKTVGKAATETKEVAKQLFQYQSPAKQKIAELIETRTGDIETARFKLGESLAEGSPKVIKDRVAVEAIKQGFDEGVIAAVKGSSTADKQAFKKMVNIMEKGKKNARYAMENRPSDVVGDLLMGRLRVVQKANKNAGKKLDQVAKSLKGKPVEFQPSVDTFIDDLENMGISLDMDRAGKVKPNFRGSDIEGLAGPESVINRMVKRLSTTKPPDAFELHRLKKFIDEQVTFGKNAEGLAGKTESVLKKLRRNLDRTLDENFPKYDEVNTQYAETISALDSFQDVAGKRMDLTGPNAEKATGTLMRRIMSNAQSRINVLDSVNEIENVAKKFGGKLGDQLQITGPVDKAFSNDLLSQILFVDELDAVFGPVARTSFQGQIVQAIPTSKADLIKKAVGAAAKKVRGIDEKGAFKSIKELLK